LTHFSIILTRKTPKLPNYQSGDTQPSRRSHSALTSRITNSKAESFTSRFQASYTGTMASQLPFTIRRIAASTSSAAIKAPRRNISATPVFQRRCLSAATRGLGSFSQRRGILALESHSYKPQLQNTHLQNQLRRFSDEPTPSLREWGFEDVRPRLPFGKNASNPLLDKHLPPLRLTLAIPQTRHPNRRPRARRAERNGHYPLRH
jgi:hypothetical protein